MASRNAQLADAVKSALNAAPAGTFTLPFTAKRIWAPSMDMKALRTLTVSVIAASDDSDRTARDVDEHEQVVFVGVEKVLSDQTPNPALEAANAEIDQLVLLVEQVNDFFNGETIDQTNGYFVNSTIRVLCDPPSLNSQGLFRGIVAVNFLKPVV